MLYTFSFLLGSATSKSWTYILPEWLNNLFYPLESLRLLMAASGHNYKPMIDPFRPRMRACHAHTTYFAWEDVIDNMLTLILLS